MRFIVEIDCNDPRITKEALTEELQYALSTAFDHNTNPRFPKRAEINFEVEPTDDP